MPQTAQTIFLWANIIVCLVSLVFAERFRRKSGSSVGYLLLLAGALTVFNEPVVDILGLCWFASRGSVPLFSAWGITIPAFMLPVYCWYVGGQALLSLTVLESGATGKGIFKLYSLFAVINILLEVPGLNMGIYAYYGRQPFVLLGFPCWWATCNALMPIVMAAIVFRLKPIWKTPLSVLIVFAGPMSAGMTNGAVALPVWFALNSGMPLWATRVAALVSLCMGLMFARLLIAAVAIEPRTTLER